MKVIIAGNGKFGQTIARQLAADDYDLTIIDKRADVLQSSAERYDTMSVQGNCASREVLLKAGIEEADLLIVTTGADEINLLCCVTAHHINPNIHTIARIRNPEYSDSIFSMRSVFALSMAVNPEKQTAAEIERLLKYPGFLKRDTFAKGRAEIVELRVDANSKLKNVRLADVHTIVKTQILVCAVLRGGAVITPGGDFVLEEGDRIFVTASSQNLATLLKNLGIITHKVRRVILCGGGRVSYYLADLLTKSGISVQIIEQDEKKAVELAERIPNACVIQGDASDEAILENEGIDNCDALVTLTGVDELNIIISLYGKNCGVPQVITKLGRSTNGNIIDSLELGSMVCPKEICCNTIVRYARAIKNQAGAAASVHSIADGRVEAMEFWVDSKTRYCGKPLKEIKFKKGVLLVGITRNGKHEIPNGESVFKEGDSLIVVRSGEGTVYQLNDIFM